LDKKFLKKRKVKWNSFGNAFYDFLGITSPSYDKEVENTSKKKIKRKKLVMKSLN